MAKKKPITGHLTDLKEQPQAEISLAIWQSQGQLTWQTPFTFQRTPGKLKGRDPSAYQQMLEYAKTKNCRWQYLLTAFGFTEQGNNWRCGHCDRCK